MHSDRHRELQEEAYESLDDPETLKSVLEDIFAEFRFLEARDERVARFAAAVHNFADWQWGGYERERDSQTFSTVRDALWAEVREHVEFYTGKHSTHTPRPGEQADVPGTGGVDCSGRRLPCGS